MLELIKTHSIGLKKDVDENIFDLLWLENIVQILNKEVTEGVLKYDEVCI